MSDKGDDEGVINSGVSGECPRKQIIVHGHTQSAGDETGTLPVTIWTATPNPDGPWYWPPYRLSRETDAEIVGSGTSRLSLRKADPQTSHPSGPEEQG